MFRNRIERHLLWIIFAQKLGMSFFSPFESNKAELNLATGRNARTAIAPLDGRLRSSIEKLARVWYTGCADLLPENTLR